MTDDVSVCLSLSGEHAAAVRPRGLGPVPVRHAAGTVAERGRPERHGTTGESHVTVNTSHTDDLPGNISQVDHVVKGHAAYGQLRERAEAR